MAGLTRGPRPVDVALYHSSIIQARSHCCGYRIFDSGNPATSVPRKQRDGLSKDGLCGSDTRHPVRNRPLLCLPCVSTGGALRVISGSSLARAALHQRNSGIKDTLPCCATVAWACDRLARVCVKHDRLYRRWPQRRPKAGSVSHQLGPMWPLGYNRCGPVIVCINERLLGRGGDQDETWTTTRVSPERVSR
jgi:hypothetical protein